MARVLALTVLIRPTSNISNIREVKGKKKKDRCLMQQRQSVPEREVGEGEGRYFEVYPGCLARANALFTEVEWLISSH